MPAVNLRHIEIFHAVMTAGNLTEAARMLNTSQPTVSRELARFEQVLGLKLFERSRGRLHPTIQGLRLFEEVQRSWYGTDRIVSAAESLREFRQGELSIVCLPVFSQSFTAAAAAISRALSAGQYSDSAAGVTAAGRVAVGTAPRSGVNGNAAYTCRNETHRIVGAG